MENRDNLLILVVEDDRASLNLICTVLETQHYSYRFAQTGEEAIKEAVTYSPSLILLDLGLPDMFGTEIIKKIRAWSGVPIIVVSSRGSESDKIEAFDCGADDYIVKPYSGGELLARIRAWNRRMELYGRFISDEPVYRNGGLKLDYASGRIFSDGEEIHLTPIEYKLLCLLAKNTGKVLTHQYIINEIWHGRDEIGVPALRVFMTTLRKKVEADPSAPRYIQTHIGIGYRMIKCDGERNAV